MKLSTPPYEENTSNNGKIVAKREANEDFNFFLTIPNTNKYSFILTPIWDML